MMEKMLLNLRTLCLTAVVCLISMNAWAYDTFTEGSINVDPTSTSHPVKILYVDKDATVDDCMVGNGGILIIAEGATLTVENTFYSYRGIIYVYGTIKINRENSTNNALLHSSVYIITGGRIEGYLQGVETSTITRIADPSSIGTLQTVEAQVPGLSDDDYGWPEYYRKVILSTDGSDFFTISNYKDKACAHPITDLNAWIEEYTRDYRELGPIKNSLRFAFTGDGTPAENEHSLIGSHITFSEDGRQMNFTTNGATATYDMCSVSGMSYFSGTPTVSPIAYQDPDSSTPSYYTTFYSSLEAYTVSEGIKAYTAEVYDDEVWLTAIEGDVIPQGEAVLLYSDISGDMTMEVADPSLGTKSGDNQLQGVDVATAQDASNIYYMLSYGQNKLGFYKMGDSMMLPANKAFVTIPADAQQSVLRMVFYDNAATGIGDVNVNSSTCSGDVHSIYSTSGYLMNKLQRGVNVIKLKDGSVRKVTIK